MEELNYYQLISDMGKEAMWEKKANGETMHLAPLGFKNVRIEGRSVIVIDQNSYRYIEEGAILRDQGYSFERISEILYELGLRSKRGKRVTAMGIWRALKRIPR